MRYAKVTAKFDDGRRTFLIKVTRETPRLLFGLEVDHEGEPVEQRGSRHMIVFGKSDIVKIVPMRMNLHYAELEPDDG